MTEATANDLKGAKSAPSVTAGKLLRALRAFSLPVSVLPVLAATAAVLPVGRWRWDVLVASVLGAGLLHLTGNLMNDYFDFLARVDCPQNGDDRRPGRLLVNGLLAPPHVLGEAAVCGVLAGGAAGYLTWRCGAGVLGFAAVATAGLYAYTGPPFRLKYRALGEPTVFVVFGPALVIGAAWAQTGRFEGTAILLSIPIGLATTAILVGNSIRDRREDAAAGIRTLGQIADGRLARVLYVVLVAASTLGVAAMAAAGMAPAVLGGAPAALVLLAGPIRTVWADRRLADIDAQTARFETVLLAAILLGYLLAPLV